MTKKRNPASPNRKQTNISAFTNTKKLNSQKSPQKRPNDKLQTKDMQVSTNPTTLSPHLEQHPTETGDDTNNPFHVLSDEDEVMEDAMDEVITQETEFASHQTGVAMAKNASSNSSTDGHGSDDSEQDSTQEVSSSEKDSKPSASNSMEETATENTTYSCLSTRDKVIADKAKAANRLRKKELLQEYERQASAQSVTNSSSVSIANV
jgi:hypothetical protein